MPRLFVVLITVMYVACCSGLVQAQNKSTTIEVIQGKKYYIHEVNKGETLYGIAKIYNVSMDVIAHENPDIFNGIKPGDKLRIPIQTTTYETKTHTVEKGETLYAIARKYNVTIEEIVKKNPDASGGIKVGQQLVIPVHAVGATDNTETKTTKENPPVKGTTAPVKQTEPNPSKHTVQKGETVYSISKQFNVPEETLYKLNPDIKTNGLTIGKEIILKTPALLYAPDTTSKKPTKTKVVENVTKEEKQTQPVPIKEGNCNTLLPAARTIKVALLIPLESDVASLEDEDATTDVNFKPASKPYLEYYEGFLMALDTIRKQGLSVELLQYEVKHDSAKIKQILNEKAMQDVDLIIGPFSENIFGLVAAWAEKKQINVIDPINTSNHSLYNYSNVFQLNTSLISQLEQESRFLASFDSVNIAIIKSGSSDETPILSAFKKKFATEFSKNFPQKQASVKEIIFSQSGEDTNIEKALDNNKTNVVIIPSSSQVFVLKVITKLNEQTKFDKLILSYLPLWKKFEQNFELEHIFNLHSFATHPFYVNYEDANVKKFILDYRFLYKIEPSKFSFLGYDSGIYFLTMVQKYGKQFELCANTCHISSLTSHFYFEKYGEKGGYENKGIYITRYNENINDVTISNIITDKIMLPLSLPHIELRKVGIQK